jgi:hypothetical protein
MDSRSYILMALAGDCGYMVVTVLAKRLRNAGVEARSLLAVYGFLTPIWLIAAGFCLGVGLGKFSPLYVLMVAVWAATCFCLNAGNIHLSRYQSLSESLGYRFAFTALWALAADVIVFGNAFDPHRLIIIALMCTGGIALNFIRQKHIDPALRMRLSRRLPVLLVLALIEITTYTLFKKAALMQPSHFFHNVFSQSIVFPLFFIIGGRSFKADYKAGHIAIPYAVAMCAVLLVAVILDGFALPVLPLIFIVTLGLVKILLYAVHDLKTGELPMTLASGGAIAMIGGGLVYTLAKGS